MRGSVIKRNDHWYVKIELDPDPLTGKRRQKWHSGFPTKRAAERARVDLLSKVDRGEYVEVSKQTVSEYLAEWLKAIEPTVKPATHESYSRNMRNHVVPHIGSTRLVRVDAGALNGLYATLLASGRKANWRAGKGYSQEVIDRALELRAEGVSLKHTAERLRDEQPEASEITKDTLASLLRRTAAADEGVVGRGPGLHPKTVRYVHTILHRAFRDAVRWGRLPRNPVDAADAPKVGESDLVERAWSAETLATFLATCLAEGDPLYALWVVLATTGMRRGEALGLRWSDVDLDRQRIRVVQTLIQIRGKISISSPKTFRGRRPVALDPATVAVLREHRARCEADTELTGISVTEDDLIFRRPDGTPLHPNAVTEQFIRRGRAMGLPRLTLHGLRHTWATLALGQGVHPKVVQERLGHATIAITLGIYSHVTPILHDDAAQLVASLILPHTAF
jgi:integrase